MIQKKNQSNNQISFSNNSNDNSNQNFILNKINPNNFDNQNVNKMKEKSIIDEFSSPPLIGLQNVGATCYMNATLQCFCQIKKFVNYFKYKPYINQVIGKYNDSKKLCLTDSFKYLIENLWPNNQYYINNQYNHKNSNNKYFAPYKFKEKISKMNPLFEGAQANDSKDLVNFIIMTLHEELNKSTVKINKKIIIDQTNPKEVFKNFVKIYMEENKSKISDLFYGMSKTCTQCTNCTTKKYNFQIYFFLKFPLEEIRKYKMKKIQNQFKKLNENIMNINPILYQQYLFNIQLNMQNLNSVNIYDCFEYNQKIDYFTGENAMYCNFCKRTIPSSYFTLLYTLPEILIIVLNRGKGIEFNVKLEFTEELNLYTFVENNKEGYLYKLIGVVTHLGESGASGHFIAYCKSPIDKKWYQYNDDLVTKVNDFNRQIKDYAMPYILFFQKEN